MIHVDAKNIKQAWRETLRRLYDEGASDEAQNFYRRSPALIEIQDTKDEHYDELYPLPVADIAEGNRYFISGEGEENQTPRAQLYRKRIFTGTESEASQLERIIRYLQQAEGKKRALLSLSQPEDMEMNADEAPELTTIVFEINDGALDTHVHALGSNAYRHLLPNMSKFATLQHHVSERLGVPHGKYSYFDNSLHFHLDDRDHVDLLLAP